jgi:hypothetical protein
LEAHTNENHARTHREKYVERVVVNFRTITQLRSYSYRHK